MTGSKVGNSFPKHNHRFIWSHVLHLIWIIVRVMYISLTSRFSSCQLGSNGRTPSQYQETEMHRDGQRAVCIMPFMSHSTKCYLLPIKGFHSLSWRFSGIYSSKPRADNLLDCMQIKTIIPIIHRRSDGFMPFLLVIG